MKAIVHDWHTDIELDGDEVETHCTPGKGADTCSWLLAGHGGWSCCYHHKHPSIIKRRKTGDMVAMRDGCDKVKNFDQFTPGEHLF